MDTTITVGLHKKTKAFVDLQAETKGFGSSEEYVRSLLEAKEAAWRKRIDKMLLDGINSGPATSLTSADWNTLKTNLKKRLEEDKECVQKSLRKRKR